MDDNDFQKQKDLAWQAFKKEQALQFLESKDCVREMLEYVDWAVKNKKTDSKAFRYFLERHGGREKVLQEYNSWLRMK